MALSLHLLHELATALLGQNCMNCLKPDAPADGRILWKEAVLKAQAHQPETSPCRLDIGTLDTRSAFAGREASSC